MNTTDQKAVVDAALYGQPLKSASPLTQLWLSSSRGIPRFYSQCDPGYDRRIYRPLQARISRPLPVNCTTRPIATLVGEGYTDEQIAWRLSSDAQDIYRTVQSIVRAAHLSNDIELAMQVRLGGLAQSTAALKS